jgi:threonine dehydrogenase-like Zn-dependent dehydrogenase
LKAWIYYDFNDFRLEDVPAPEVKPGWIIVKVKVVQPSVTEVLLSKGIPTVAYDLIKKRLSEEAPIQLFGHEFAGEVTEIGEGVTDFNVGDRITAQVTVSCGKCYLCSIGQEEKCTNFQFIGYHFPGALAEYVAIPVRPGVVTKLPDNISDSEGAVIQPLSDCVASVDSAELKMGDVVAMIGQGCMGLLTMQVTGASAAGKIITIDVRKEVLDISSKLGADEIVNAVEEDPVKKVLELTHQVGADVVFESAGGSPKAGLSGFKTLQQAIDMVRGSGKILQISHFEAPIDKFDIAEFRRKCIRFIFPDKAGRRTLEHTINLVASGRVRLKPLITHMLDGLEKLPEAIEITSNKTKYKSINPAQLKVA